MYKFVLFSAVILLLLGFSTLSAATITVELKDGSGAPITSGATLRYLDGTWKTDATNNGNGTWTINTSAASLYYEMTYNYGKQQIGPFPNSMGTVTFQTTSTTVRLVTGTGTGLSGGVAGYNQWAWNNFGTTDGTGNTSVVELLPGSYYFNMAFNKGTQQIGPLAISGASQTVTFTTTATTVRLQAATGAGLSGSVAGYHQGAWNNFGTTDETGNTSVVELLPGSYYFNMAFNYGKQQVGPLTVSGNAQTVTFQTTKVTVRLENCSHTGFAGGVARYNQGTWNALPNTDASGNTSIELLPGNYHFDMDYHYGHQQVGPLAVAGNSQTVLFQTTSVSLEGSGTKEYHQGAWHIFTNPIDLLPGNYYFRIGGAQVGPYNVSGCTFYRAFVTVELRNGAGGFITSGGSLRYHDGSWKTDAVDNHNGTFSVIATAPSVYYEMTYNYGKQQIGPYPATTSPVTFQTTATTVRLENSAHTGLAGGIARFNQGAWFSFGTTGASGNAPPMELLPGSYYFDMDFNHGHQQLGPLTISGDAPHAQTVLFQTTTTKVQLLSGGGGGLSGGVAGYNQSAWHNFGTTDGTGLAGVQELLPGSYHFDMVYNNGRQQIGPTNVAGNTQTITFTTTTTTVRLLSGGSGGGLPGGVARFNQGTWQPVGTTGADGNISPAVELLPGSYSFDMVYNNGRQQLGPMNITGLTQTVTFTTTTTTVRLENCDHTGFPDGVARYHQGTWNSFGTTEASGNTPAVELLPGSYYFDMNYNHGRQQLGPLAVAGNTQIVPFQTTTVTISGTGTTEYHQGAWHTFTSPIELLPGNYYFREDGNQVGPLSVPGCSFSGSLVKGSGTLAALYGSPTVKIDAEVSADGPAGGTFHITYAIGTGHPRAGVAVSGNIVCMRLGDNIVYLAGLVTASNSSEWAVGQYVRFGIQDASPDNLNYTVGEDSAPDCDTFSQTADLPLVAGGYTILHLGGGALPALPNVSAGEDKLLNCTITSVTLDGSSSTTGATASWSGPDNFTSNSFTPTVGLPGTYTLTVTGPNGCKASDEVFVNQDVTPPTCNLSPPDPLPVYGTTGNTLSVAAGFSNYAWSLDAAAITAGWSITDGQGTNTITYKAGNSSPATFSVTVTGANGCQGTSETSFSCTDWCKATYAYCLSDEDTKQLTRVRMDVVPPVKTVVVNRIIYGGSAFTGGKPLSGFEVGKPIGGDTEAMARDGKTGTTYIISNKKSVSALFKLNLQTGYAHSIGYTYNAATGAGIDDINALAFNEQTNELYGITVDGDHLLKIDTFTAKVSVYQNPITDKDVDLEGASFDHSVSTPRLYVISEHSKGEIFKVNLSTGEGTLVGKTKLGIETIEFTKGGRVYAASNDGNIYQIDRTTFEASLFAHSTQVDGEGLVFEECCQVLAKSMTSRDEQAEIRQVEEAASVPTEFALHQNYPNPFNPMTQLQFDLPKAGAVNLAIYDIVGHLVRTLATGEYTAGRHHAIWDATNEQGMKVGSGIYFCRFESNQFVAVRKMTLAK